MLQKVHALTVQNKVFSYWFFKNTNSYSNLLLVNCTEILSTVF